MEDVNPEVTFMEPGVTSKGNPPKRISYNAPAGLYFFGDTDKLRLSVSPIFLSYHENPKE
jgi:hypothetical protein